MSQKKSTTYRLVRAALILVVAILGFVAVVDRDKVPGLIEKCPWVATMYDKRDSLMAAKTEEKTEATKKAERKKLVQKTAGKGYSGKERKKMDQLMSWGSQDY